MLAGKPNPAAAVRSGAVSLARLRAVERELPRFLLQAGGQREPPAPVAAPTPAGPKALAKLRAHPRQQSERLLGGECRAMFFSQGRSYVLQLYDFSVGGVALRAAPHEVVGLQVGKKLPGVQIELGSELSMTIDLEIRLMRRFHSAHQGEQVQIGCRFANLSAALQERLAGMVTAASGRRRPV
jgi:hypothetical protein